MGFTFQGSDFSDFLASTPLADAEMPQGSGEIKLMTPKGNISFQEYLLKDDLSILQGSYQLNDDVTIFGQGDAHLLEMHFNLSEHAIYYHNHSIKREIAPAMTGNISFLNPEENKAKISFNKDIAYQTFDIHLPLSILDNYSGESRAMDKFLYNIDKNLSSTLSANEIKVNARIFNTIQEIKNCSFEGLTKKIYLESKSYELMAFVHESAECPEQNGELESSDVEKIKHAARLIRENLDQPFTIIALARKVGINQTKLKKGFKTVLNHTVFGYLQQIRMDRAKRYLLDTNLPIQEISSLSGYHNASNFSIAFKQTFGYSPIKLRSNK